MNHLVVFAHPNTKSFGKGIADTIRKASEEKGAKVEVRDLYAIGFDPVLKPTDFEAYAKGEVLEDVRTEQDYIRWADVITFVYPVWWTGFPALLKGYVDRVFTYGFAYASVDGAVTGLLPEKKALLFSTTGTPGEVYEQNGTHQAMKQTSDVGVFHFSGIEVLNHTFFGAVPYVSDDVRKDYLKEVEKVIQSNL